MTVRATILSFLHASTTDMLKSKRPRLVVSALAGSAQMVIVSLTGMIIYGYMIRMLGAETVGGWLAVMALGMMACIFDLGLREALVRRTATAIAVKDPKLVGENIMTLTLTVAVIMAASLSIALGPWTWTKSALGPGAAMLGGHGATIALIIWLQRIADMTSATLEGMQRYDLTARSNAFSSAVALITALLLVPKLGVRGTEIALLSQNCCILVINLYILRGELSFIPGSAWRWRCCILRECLAYGLSVQGMVAAVLLVENLAKVMLARMGATALLSYFDFAFRVTRGVRNFIVAGNRVMVPRIAESSQHGNNHDELYQVSFSVLAVISTAAFTVIAASSGLISTLLTGAWNESCVFVFWPLCATWLAFCLMDPSLNMQLGTARLKPALIGHILMPVLAAAFSFPLLRMWQGEGLVTAIALSIVLGCLIVVLSYHSSQGITIRTIAPFSTLMLLICGAAGAWAGLQTGRLLMIRGWTTWQWGPLTITVSVLFLVLPSLFRLRNTPLGQYLPGFRKR